MAKLEIEKLFGGMAFTDSATRPTEGFQNEFSRSIVVDLFQDNKIGQLAPGNMFDALTAGTTLTALPLDGVVDSSGTAWVVTADSRLFRVDLTTDNIVDAFDPGTTIVGGTDYVGMVVFRDGSGSEWIAVSYDSTGTDGDVWRIRNNGTGRNTSWASGLTGSGKLTKGVPKRLWIGADGLVYCTNGQYVFQTDPETSNGSHQALNLGAGWIGVTGTAYQNLSAILAYKQSLYTPGFSKGECRLYLWDGFSPEPNDIIPINDNYASAMIEKEGLLYITTQGRDNKTRLFIFGGRIVRGVTSCLTSSIGSAPRQGSIDIFRNLLHWGQGSTTRRISAVIPVSEGRYGLHDVMHPYSDTSVIADMGMVKNLHQSNLYTGIQVGNTYYITKINRSKYYTSAELTTVLYKLPYRSIITKITLEFSQFGSGASLTVSLFKDYDAVSVGGAADLLNKTLTNATLGSARSFSIPTFINDVNSFYMHFGWNHASATNTAAIIRKIIVDFFPTNAI